jgi:hypothetical protein
MTAPATQALPSYARDAEHAALIAEHFARLCDAAPPLPPRLEHLLRPDMTAREAENAA